MAICIEHEYAAWIRTERFVLATIRAHIDIRDHRPSPYELLFERLPLGEGIASRKRQTQQCDGGRGESSSRFIASSSDESRFQGSWLRYHALLAWAAQIKKIEARGYSL